MKVKKGLLPKAVGVVGMVVNKTLLPKTGESSVDRQAEWLTGQADPWMKIRLYDLTNEKNTDVVMTRQECLSKIQAILCYLTAEHVKVGSEFGKGKITAKYDGAVVAGYLDKMGLRYQVKAITTISKKTGRSYEWWSFKGVSA